MNQFLGAVVVGHDLDARQHATGLVVELSNRFVDVVQGRQRFFALGQAPMPCTTSFSSSQLALAAFGHRVAFFVDDRPAQEHAAHARLMADDHSLVVRGVFPVLRPAIDDVAHLDGHVVVEASTTSRFPVPGGLPGCRYLPAAAGSVIASTWSTGSMPWPIRPRLRTASTVSPCTRKSPTTFELLSRVAFCNCSSVMP